MNTKQSLVEKLRILSQEEKNELISEICRLSEKQYRKGYQNGVSDYEEGKTSSSEAAKFRMEGETKGYRLADESGYILQISAEIGMESMEALNYIFS